MVQHIQGGHVVPPCGVRKDKLVEMRMYPKESSHLFPVNQNDLQQALDE